MLGDANFGQKVQNLRNFKKLEIQKFKKQMLVDANATLKVQKEDASGYQYLLKISKA